MIKTKRGLTLPIGGSPEQVIGDAQPTRSVALLGSDYPGLKPTMVVEEGDKVALGQILFTDKKNPSVNYTSPASGTVSAINRGLKRVFQSVVIELEGDEGVTFSVTDNLDKEQAKKLLIDSGEWTSLRNRPYNKVPSPEEEPANIFVTPGLLQLIPAYLSMITRKLSSQV